MTKCSDIASQKSNLRVFAMRRWHRRLSSCADQKPPLAREGVESARGSMEQHLYVNALSPNSVLYCSVSHHVKAQVILHRVHHLSQKPAPPPLQTLFLSLPRFLAKSHFKPTFSTLCNSGRKKDRMICADVHVRMSCRRRWLQNASSRFPQQRPPSVSVASPLSHRA